MGKGGATRDAAPLKRATVPPQKSLGWFGGGRARKATTLLGDVFCICPVVPYHALGGDFAASAADGLSSAPPPAAEPASPLAAEAAGASVPPACEQKTAFCLCYFGLLQRFLLSRGTGICRAGGVCVAVEFGC